MVGAPGEEQGTAEASAAFSGGGIGVCLKGEGFVDVISLAKILLKFSGISFGVAGNFILALVWGLRISNIRLS